MSDKLVEQQFFIEHVLKEAFPAGMSIREIQQHLASQIHRGR